MVESKNCINFKLNDPDKSYKKVHVAGTFNDWNSTINELTFNNDTKNWLLDLLVQLSPNDKILYKYIIDGNNWIYDKNEPYETDSQGNQNNIGYPKSINDNDNNDNIVHKDDEISDHKSFHDNELFDNTESSLINQNETAPTSGEENSNELENENGDDDELISITVHSTDKNTQIIIDENNQKDLSKNGYKPNSFWESIKWFFKYYILSLFYPQETS
jgi:hypothetical protein